MVKRVYIESVKKWGIKAGIPATTMIGLLFAYLTFMGAIEITGFSGDQVCAGTIEDPCYAYINFTANEDIFIYPIGYDPWGRDTIFEFSPGVKDWKLQRSWGKGWRDIPLDKTCTGTWCGAPNSDGVTYSWVLREDRDYRVRIVALKNKPSDTIKWAVNYEDKEYLDPVWLPAQDWIIEGDSIYINDSNVLINITPHTSNNPIIEFTSKTYTGDVDIVFGFDTDKAKPISAKTNPREELVQKSYTCEESFNYTLSPKQMWCYTNKSVANNQTNETEWIQNVIFARPFESGNLQEKTIYWSELETLWDDVSGAFNSVNYEFQGFDKWHYKKNISITQGEINTLKVEFESKSWEGYKYFFGIKPSSETLQEAIANGHFYYIDPWTEDFNTNLQASWSLEETSGSVLDDTANNYDGTNNGATRGVTGVHNLAFNFTSSVPDYVSFGDVLDIGTGAFTVAAWIRINDDGGWHHVIGKTADLTTTSWSIRIVTDGRVQCAIRNGGNSDNAITTNTLSYGVWTFVACSRPASGGTVKIYLNNDSSVNETNTNLDLDNAYDFRIGSNDNNNGFDLNGDVDQALVYIGRELSAAEIANLANNYFYEELGPAPPEIIANATRPVIVYTNTDWLINVTASNGNETYLDAYTQFYVNDSLVGGEIWFNLTNNTNQLISTLLNGNFSAGNSLAAEIWVSNRVTNSTKTNLTATVQFFNISGTIKDGDENNLNASVFVVNQSDNSLVGNVTSLNGIWTIGPIMPGTYIITGYDPTNSTLDGDAEPHVVVPA